MLVLSRKEDQSIVFPNLGIRIEIVKVQGNRVSVGIEAPKAISIVRGELQSVAAAKGRACSSVFQELGQLIEILAPNTRQELRDRLNTATLSVHAAQQQVEQGGVESAAISLSKAVDALEHLNRMFEPYDSTQCVSESQPKYEQATCRNINFDALSVEDNDVERDLLDGVLEMAGRKVFSGGERRAAFAFTVSRL